jgi:alpha-L-fucosidase
MLLLNATPDTSGLIPTSHVERYEEFGEAVRQIYRDKKGQTSGEGRLLELRLGQATPVTHIVTMEDIRHGQIVRAYDIEGLTHGTWRKLANGTSIGYKRIDVVESILVEALRLRVTQSVGQPMIKSFAAYDAPCIGQERVNASRSEVWQKVAGWKGIEITSSWQTLDADLTPYIQMPGQYEIELRRTTGDGELEIRDVTAVIADTEAPRLITKQNRPCAWILRRTDQVTPDVHGKTALRLTARVTGKGRWAGELRFRAGQ